MERAHEWMLLRAERPRVTTGLLVAVASVAAVTGVIYPLAHVAPVVSLGVLYVLAVLVVSTYWGAALGVATSILSAAAFNVFHLPPTGRFTIADSRNWLALVAFLIVAVAVSALAEAARARAREAERRRRDADLAAELTRILLGASPLPEALPVAARRLAEAFGLRSAAIELAPAPTPAPEAVPLRAGATELGWLVVPPGAPAALGESLVRAVAALESVLAAALARDRLQHEVVETASLRRSDELKTALLRSVSHDLRTPLTAVLTAASALGSAGLADDERGELQRGIVEDATRLDRLIANLLDLSRIEAGIAAPRPTWCAAEEVLRGAAEVAAAGSELSFAIDRDLPLIRGDAVQLERAFANLIENALRYGAGHPVSIRARAVGARLRIRVVDRGGGIPPAEQDRIFAPFYRAAQPGGHRGSGLGLAIARAFVEANGGRISVESLPGQGTSFVVEFPVERDAAGEPREQREALR